MNKYNVSDKERQAIQEVVADETGIEMSLPMREAYVTLLGLQLAYHHPGVGLPMKAHWRGLGMLLKKEIIATHNELDDMLSRRWETLDDKPLDAEAANAEIKLIRGVLGDETIITVVAPMSSIYLAINALQLVNRHPGQPEHMYNWNNHIARELLNIVVQGYPELFTLMNTGFDESYDVTEDNDS